MESRNSTYPSLLRLAARLGCILLLGISLLWGIDKYFSPSTLDHTVSAPEWRQVFDTYELVCDGGFPDQKVWVVRERNILEKGAGFGAYSQTQRDTVFAGWLDAMGSCPVSLLELPDQGADVLDKFADQGPFALQ